MRSSSNLRKIASPQTVILSDSEIYHSINDLKLKLDLTLSNFKEINSYKA
ncbi:hypothetical protein LEP1GSC038_0615 [Leptospira weilii str. 2006001855]|uniref:Uncharacterized protein n=2 Tax=Leptospira weilii TaxID=28184 RepID=M6Q2Q8_9LEPT|nr:hypothetical protein LEP1GSC038_0615 [Leptospira weilii str. 2006001855]EMN89584.1 hypothetical protein LEP1GSC108_3784 [Leptospira weilii str. UI 13098]